MALDSEIGERQALSDEKEMTDSQLDSRPADLTQLAWVLRESRLLHIQEALQEMEPSE